LITRRGRVGITKGIVGQSIKFDSLLQTGGFICCKVQLGHLLIHLGSLCKLVLLNVIINGKAVAFPCGLEVWDFLICLTGILHVTRCLTLGLHLGGALGRQLEGVTGL